MPEDIIYQRIFNQHRQPIGLMSAVKINPQLVRIGWSVVCKNDKFNKVLGATIANNRALSGKSAQVPRKIAKDVVTFTDRAARYFKDYQIERPFVAGETEDKVLNSSDFFE